MSSHPPILSPHDRVFRASMSNIHVARDFFLKNLPKPILAVTDFSTLELCPQTYVDNELKLSQSDILYKVAMDNKPAYFYALCEHQSTPDKFMPYRLMKYEINIWSDHIKQHKEETLPLIVSVVFYNGCQPYCHSTDFRDLLNAPKELIELVWRKPFKLIDAHDITDEDIRKHKWFGILAFFMAHIFVRDFLPYLKDSMTILGELEQENGQDYIQTLLNYSLNTANIGNIEQFIEIVQQGLSTKTKENIMTLAEQFEKRGFGQGFEKGELNGNRMLLNRQISKKFGSIPEVYLDQLNNANQDYLLELSEKIIEANTLDEVFITH